MTLLGDFLEAFRISREIRAERRELKKILAPLKSEIIDARKRVGEGKPAYLNSLRGLEPELPPKILQEASLFQRLLEDHARELRVLEDQVRLVIQDAIMATPGIPRQRASIITEMTNAGWNAWTSGTPGATGYVNREYLDQALYDVYAQVLASGDQALPSRIADVAPFLHEQLSTLKIASQYLASLCAWMNQQRDVRCNETMGRVQALSKSVLDFKFRVLMLES